MYVQRVLCCGVQQLMEVCESWRKGLCVLHPAYVNVVLGVVYAAGLGVLAGRDGVELLLYRVTQFEWEICTGDCGGVVRADTQPSPMSRAGKWEMLQLCGISTQASRACAPECLVPAGHWSPG